MNQERMNLFIERDGTRVWFHPDGYKHRDNAPAVITPDGTKHWYQRGILHRDNGPASTTTSGSEKWYQNGIIHRDNGPAYTHNGDKIWYQNGNYHRDDGPAISNPDRYYIQGREITSEKDPLIFKMIKSKEAYRIKKEKIKNNKGNHMDDPRFKPVLEANINFVKEEIQEKLQDFVENIALGHFKDPDEAQEIADKILEKLQTGLQAQDA